MKLTVNLIWNVLEYITMCDLHQLWLLGFLISIAVLFEAHRIINHFYEAPTRLKKPNAQETRLIELMYSQLCSRHHLVPQIAIALIIGAISIYAVSLGNPNLSTQYENASIVLLSFSMGFLYYDLLYLSRKMRKYEEVLGIRKVLRKFELPSP